LVKTSAKVHVYKDGKRIKSLAPAEFNTYLLEPGETYNLSDFSDPRIILNATKHTMWPAIENISNARKMGRSTSDIYILTARSKKAQIPIHTFLQRNGIDMPLENVITVGLDGPGDQDIAGDKEKVLRNLKSRYADLTFFDDNRENILLASRIEGVRTRLVDWNK
jgi:hypothetical protein